MAHIIDGRKIAAKIRGEIKQEISKLPTRPKLAVIQVGNDPASSVYVKMKERACKEVGIISETFVIEEERALKCAKKGACAVTEEIIRLNKDREVSGILVQLPLPKGLDSLKVISTIAPEKDVDCLHSVNVGKLFLEIGDLVPCTPHGCLELIRSTGIVIKGKNAVVVGRSNIVGKPMAQLLLKEDATVTICHRYTENLARYTKEADILVVAVGVPRLIKENMVKDTAVVIDVGITREETSKEEPSQCRLVGDVDYERVAPKVAAVTPVPGGVGPMTIAMLLKNTFVCWKKQNQKQL